MKLWKRLLSLVLAFGLIIGMGPAFPAALADGGNGAPDANETMETAGSSTLNDWTATQTFADGWVEAQIDLPQISETDWQASADAITAAWNATGTNPGSNFERRVELRSGSNYILASLTVHRNVKNITFQLQISKNLIGASTDFKKTVQTGAHNYIVYEGQTVTVRVRKIGNFVEAQLVDEAGTVLENWAFTIAEGAAFHSVTDWTARAYVGKTGQFGKSWDATNGLTDFIDLSSCFSGITLGKFNKTVALTAGEHITLPVTKTPADTELPRTAYQVGEALAVTVDSGYALFANGAPVAEPLRFEIPDAENVALSAEEVAYSDVTVVPAVGITVSDVKDVGTSTKVTITVDPEILKASTLAVTGENTNYTLENGGLTAGEAPNTYTFIMPGEPVTVTCDELAVNEVLETAGSSTLNDWTATQTFADGWVEAQIDLPQISMADWQASADAITAAWNATGTNPGSNFERRVELRSGSNYILASLTVHRNVKNITFQLQISKNLIGASTDFKKTVQTGAHNYIVYEGQTVTVKLRKIGNFVEAQLVDANGKALETWAFTIAEDAAFHSVTDWTARAYVGKTGQFGKSWDATNGLTDFIDLSSCFSGITLGKFNKTVALTAGEHITLPVTKTPAGAELPRTAYAVGETLALTVADGYRVYASDVLVADPQNYQILNAGEVVLSARKIIYSDITVTPAAGIAVAPATNVEAGAEVTVTVDPEILKVSTLAVTGENTNYTIENGGLIAGENPNTYIFVMPGEPVTVTCSELTVNEVLEMAGSSTLNDWTATQTFADGWVEVQIDLPQISETDWQASADAITAAWNATGTNPGSNFERRVELRSGSNYILASLTVHRNVKNITFQLQISKNLIGASTDFKKTVQTGAHNYIVYEGQTVTVRVRKIGNFVEAQLVDEAGKVLENWAFTIAEGAAFHSVTDWTARAYVGKTGQFGKSWDATNGLTDFIDLSSCFSGITLGKFNKTVVVTAGEHITLPVTKTPAGAELPRTAYQVGEVIAVTVDSGYALLANGAAVADPLNYQVPNEAAVVFSAQKVNYNDVTIAPTAGITVAPATNVEEGAVVTVTVDPETLKVSTLTVSGENTNYTIGNGGLTAGETPNTYTFIMPGEPVTVTCDGLVVNEVVETAGSSTLTNWTATQTFADGWVEAQIDLPQISETDWQASADAITAAWNATQTNPGSNVERRVELRSGSYSIMASITIHRNVRSVTFQLQMPKNLIGASADLKKTVQTGAHNYIVYEGQTVTVKLRKIGNFVEAQFVDADGKVLENWAFTIAEDAAFHSVTDWTVKVSAAKNGQFGKNWDETNGLTDIINTDAFFTGVTVGKINKTVALTSDEYVKLPVTKTADGDQLSRTAYQVGEVVKLTVVKGYILYANDAVVVDPLFYEIPDVDTVALVCQEDEDALANATADINDAFNAESLMVNRGWSSEMQILMGAARAYGSANSYLNGIFGSERWSSYTVSATATVYGHTSTYTAIAALCVKTDSISGGYEFGLAVESGAQNGYIRLYDRTNGKILYADGSIKLDLGKAYNLKLVVTANTLTGYLDGRWLFSVNVEETVGGVGIRAQNANAAFDNIKVTDIEMTQ